MSSVSAHVRIPRDFNAKPIPVRAVARFYRLLDSGAIQNRGEGYAGELAAKKVAEEFNVSSEMVWRWVREHVEQNSKKSA